MKRLTFIAAMSLAIVTTTACGHTPEEGDGEEMEAPHPDSPQLGDDGTAGEPGAIALFEGKMLDLSRDWGEAKSCLIWKQAGISECFRTDEEMEARDAEATRQHPEVQEQATAAARCSGALHLYEHVNRQGRHLMFRDRGYWQNLGGWGFNDKLSSFATGPCGVHLAYHVNGGGGWYPGNTGANVVSHQMISGWNDEVSSIYIR